MEHTASVYGLWPWVLFNSAIFIIFAFSFTKPKTKRDWRSFGAFSGFVIALFAEMYGFPLTIYLLSGWLGSKFPQTNLLSHESGHIWQTLFGLKGDPHANPIHLLSNVLIIAGFFVLAAAWRVLHAAQKEHRLASSGIYARVRHPQYLGFIVIMFGFLIQWPTLVTALMFPILVVVYVKLARREERDSLEAFGGAWTAYAARTPAFVPSFRLGQDRPESTRSGNIHVSGSKGH